MDQKQLESLWAVALAASPPELELYDKLAEGLVSAWKSGNLEAIQSIKQPHPSLMKLSDAELGNEDFSLDDAQLLIAREHHFPSWSDFLEHLELVSSRRSPVFEFESAVDAIITGDETTLEQLLRENPELIRERSPRAHRSTLLHYVGANGVEDFRQKTPANAVKIAEMLLQAGAEVDAQAEMYGGGSTTLGLVATSIHPKQAGVQIDLMETLLVAGAAVDGGSGGGAAAVNACLANGRPEAAEFLAHRGAQLDLTGAAGVGRLDLVQSFFNEDGSLKASATKAQMESGFMWACEYGRKSVVEYLLGKGIDLRAGEDTGMTGLHWAAIGGQVDTIKLLLDRGAPLEVKNLYGGTVLDQALWSAYKGDPGIDYIPVIETLIEAGARVDVYPRMKEYIDEVLRRAREKPGSDAAIDSVDD